MGRQMTALNGPHGRDGQQGAGVPGRRGTAQRRFARGGPEIKRSGAARRTWRSGLGDAQRGRSRFVGRASVGLGEPVGDGWGHGIGFWGLGLGQGRSAGGGPGRPIFEAQKMAKKAPERISKNQIFKKSKFEKNTKNGGPQRSLET